MQSAKEVETITKITANKKRFQALYEFQRKLEMIRVLSAGGLRRGSDPEKIRARTTGVYIIDRSVC